MLAAALVAGAGLTPGAEASDPAPRLLTSGGPTYTNADSFTALLHFNADVRNVDASDFEVIGSTATITGWTAVSASYYWADVSGGDLADMNGEVWVRLKAGQDIESLTGVALTDLNTVSESPITIDNTVPECAFATTATAPVTDVFTVTMTCTPQAGWSDIIVAFTQSDLVVGNAVVESFSFPGAYSATFTLRPSSTGTVTVDLPAGSLYDDASNPNPAATQFSIAADVTVPAVTFNPYSSFTDHAYSAPFTLAVRFSEDVTGFDPLTDLVMSNVSVSVQSSNSRNWVLTVTPTAEGAFTLDLPAGVAVDGDGFGNLAATQFAGTYDTTPPVFTLSSTVTAPATENFLLDIHVSESVRFQTSYLTVGNGSVSGLTGSGTDYQVTVRPTNGTEGVVTVDLAAGVAQDAAGNANPAATQFSVAYDFARPDVDSVVRTTPASAVTNADSLVFTVTFTEPVTGVDAADFEIRDSDALVPTTGSVSAVNPVSATVYEVTVSGGDLGSIGGNYSTGDAATLTVRTLLSATIEDLAGLTLNSSTAQNAQEYYSIDNTRPGITISGPATASASFTATFTFDEDVTGFALGDIVATGATLANLAGSGAVYTADLTMTGSAVTLDVAANIASDEAGNQNTAATQYSAVFDDEAPTVVSIERLTPSSVTTNASDLTWRVTFSEPVTGLAKEDFSLDGTTASVRSAVNTTGNSWDITTYGGDLGELRGTVWLSFAATQDIADLNGNPLSDLTPSGSNDNYFVVSHDRPVLASISRQTPAAQRTNATSLTWDFQFSQISRGFSLPPEAFQVMNATADVTVERYSIGFHVTASGGNLATYDGPVYIRISDTSYADEFGNTLVGAAPSDLDDGLYELDHTAPVVTWSLGTDDAESSGTLTVYVSGSEPLTGLEFDDFTVANGAVSDITPFGNGYYATITPAGDGLVTIDLAADAVTDLSGNGHSAPDQLSYMYDFTPPGVTSVEFVTTGGAPTNSDTLTWAVSFSEQLDNVSEDDFRVAGTTATITSVTQSQPTVYVVEAAGGDLASLNGPVELELGYDSDATDAGGYWLETLAPSGGTDERVVTVDNLGPTPQLSLDDPSGYSSGDFVVNVTFDEVVTGFTAADLTLTNATAAILAQDGDSFSFTISPLAEGEVTIAIAAGVMTDIAGNDSLAGDETLSVAYDLSAPELVSIERAIGPTEITDSDNLVWIVTFSEPVMNLEKSDFALDGTTASLYVGSYSPGERAGPAGVVGAESGPEAYQVVAYDGDLPSLNGVVTLSLLAGNDILDYSGQSLASLTPTGANETTYTLVNDVVAPTVVLSSAETGPVAGAFTLDIVFSEPVIRLALEDIVVSNGTASDFSGTAVPAGNAPRDGTVHGRVEPSEAEYTVTITPSADGDVTVDLAAGAAQDPSGNSSLAAAQFVIAADVTAPTVVLSTESADPVSGAFALTVTFSEDVTGLALEDLVVANGAASALTGSGAEYTVTVTPAADGDVTVDLAAGAAQDVAGNDNTAATQFTISTDGTAPTVVLSSDAAEPAIGAFTLTVTFSEEVTDLALEDFVVANAELSDLSGSGAGYEVTVTPTAGSPVTVDLPAETVIDAAGNANLAAEQFSIITDNTPPTLAITLPGEETEGPFTATFTFSEDVTGFEVDDITASNADLSEFLAVSALEYTVLVTPQTIGTIEITVDAELAEDAAGNGNVAASASIDAVAQPIEVEVVLGSDVEDPTDVTATAAVTNPGSQPVQFRTETDVDWLDVDPLTGTIPAFGEVELTITVNELANDLPAGTYTGTVTVINLSGGGAAAKGPNAETRASGDTIVVAIPLTVSIAERRGTIQLVSTTPGGVQRDETFVFTSSDSDLDALSLTTQAGYAASTPVRKLLGTYDVMQSVPAGWRLDTISCVGDTDGGSVIDLAAGRVDIDLDANEAIVCTFANTRDEAEVRLATQRAIRNFMVRRGDRILEAAPDLTRRVQDRDTRSPGQFAAEINGGTRNVSMGASLSGMRHAARDAAPQMEGEAARVDEADNGIDIWFSANYSSVSDDRAGDAADSAFGLVQLGADWMLGEQTIVGVMFQHDWMDETADDIAERAGAIRGARIEGSGWLAGPYLVREIGDGLWFDATAMYGESDNTVDPLGLYEDEFTTTRYLLRMNLTGEWRSGNWRIRPTAGVAHFEESQAAYIDSLGIDIPEQTIAIGRFQAGPQIAYRFDTSSGGWWEPSVDITGVWDYDAAQLMDENGGLVGTGGVRADARFSLRGQISPGASLAIETSFGGLGDGDFSANGARMEIRIGF
ncbi:Ig-like domain-containing protein [Maricaulis sp.]|uniref:Ig-like domain-containing protein n=1 Tax=Maricaulis sp. TaxID=1486257 RepID=UPI003A923FAC